MLPILINLTLFLTIFFSSNPAFAEPNINYYNPKSIQQGESTDIVIEGEGLNLPVIGVSGGDIFALILKRDNGGKSLTIKLAANPTAEPGEREIFLRSGTGEEVRFTVLVTPRGAPVVQSIYPNTGTVGSKFNTYIYGDGLNNSVVSTANDNVSISFYQPSNDGSFIYISGSISDSAIPGAYQFYITNQGGQAQADFAIVGSNGTNSDSIADPYSPGIYSVDSNQLNNQQLILRGNMFDANYANNVVTLLENHDGSVISKQLEIISATPNEIIVNLPEGIKSGSIAVSSLDGKSSNIKPFDFSSVTENPSSTNSNNINNPTQNTDTANNTQPNTQTTASNNTQTSTNTNPSQGNNDIAETTHNTQEATNKPSATEKNTEVLEETYIAQNIQNLNQYLFPGSIGQQTKQEVSSIDEIKDPAKLINSLEENKQIKSQVDLIMIAIDEAKNNQELSSAVKKAETLKSKVEELEKVIELEKQKGKPNQKKLAKYQQLLATAHAESRSQTFTLLNNLLKYKPQLKNLLTQRPFDLAAVQSNIPDNSAIIQYVPTDEGLIIFVVDNKNLKTRINKSITKDVLNKQVQEYRQLFENEIEKIKATGRVTPISNWKDDKSITYKKNILPLKEKTVFLYNALIEPIEKDINNKSVIAVIANGWLRYLPFQSLGKLSKDGDIKFLISDKSIVYLDSVIALNKASTIPLSSKTSVTVFANPDGSLPGANKEAELITMIFSMSTTAYVQQPFNINLINQLSKKADILHLATHGNLDGSEIDSSYLVTGKKIVNGKNTQSKLLLKDIYDLNLRNSKLIVLSGCDTGKIGNLSNEPDDIVGSLASAFRVAGANTILASLWKAHDEATKTMMETFYENIKQGNNKAESLRKAELKLKENPKYGHPLFWSLFSLIGDWR